MKTFKKVCMILISVTAVAGIGCIIAAFVMGADPRQMERLKSSRRADILNCFGFNQTMRSQLFCPKELPLRKFPWIVAVETLRQIL